jgi:hypothetical protein
MIAAPIANLIDWQTMTSQVLILITFTVVLFSAAFASSTRRAHIFVALLLGVPAVLCDIIHFFVPRPLLAEAGHAFGGALIVFTLVLMMNHLFTARKVTVNTICASLCAYLLIGVLWSLIYSVLCSLDPGSFEYAMADEITGIDTRLRFADRQAVYALYYSFVTLTTLGYGDVLPTSAPARMLATLEAVIGQIFIAVLVARLVGMHVAQYQPDPAGVSSNKSAGK